MGKIKKAASPKHESSLSPALAEFVQKTVTVPTAQLPTHLSTFPKRWLFPRGDLFHWIQPLNRFDEILEKFILHYDLNAGPQVKKFGVSYLCQEIQNDKSEDLNLHKFGYGEDGDREFVESILRFTKLLLEKCGNRSLYASTERLNDLLNTTSFSLLNTTLRLSLCLAQRHSGRQRRPPTAQYAIASQSLLALCSPLDRHAVQNGASASSSPAIGSNGGQGKYHATSNVNSSQRRIDATTLNILAQDPTNEEYQMYREWLDVELSFNGVSNTERLSEAKSSDSTRTTHQPRNLNSPSPLRRASSDLESGSRSGGPSDGTPSVPGIEPSQRSELQPGKLSISSSTILSSPIEDVLREHIAKVPTSFHYEFLSRLRTAYGIASQRQELVASRLLAISNLAYILPETIFELEVLRNDNELPKDQQLPHVLSSLVHPLSRGLKSSLRLRILAVNTLKALAKHKSRVNDIFTALGANVSHGTLHITLRETLASLQNTDDSISASDDDLDEYRDTIFSLVRSLLVDSSQTSRSGEVLSSPNFVTIYNELLKIQTDDAERLYLRAFEFFDALCQYMKDGLSILFNNDTFESLMSVFNREVTSSLELATQGKGIPNEFRVPSMDYYIPYVKQQIIKFMLPFIDKVLGQHNAIVDRILRGLIDDAALLKSLRLIIENNKSFGGHIWAGAIKVLGSFLHNEPTSYSVIAEAGLSTAFLGTITAENRLDNESFTGSSESHIHSTDRQSGSESSSHDVEMVSETEMQPSSQRTQIYDSDVLTGSHNIPPSTEAIFNVAQAFEAICLTNAGFESFQRSCALKHFFSIFESPAHVKVMQSAPFLTNLGNVFDELVRHHPALRDAVLSSVLVTVARLRFLCLSKAWSTGAGSKLWYSKPGNDMDVAGSQQSLREGLEAFPDANSLTAQESGRSLDLPSGDKLIFGSDEKLRGERFPTQKEDDDEPTVADFISCLMVFLSGLFESQTLCNSYMEAGGTELVLDFTVLPSLPHDFTRKKGDGSGGPPEIALVLHSMAESKPHLIIPSLLDRCLRTVRHLESILVDFGSPESLFKSFLEYDSGDRAQNVRAPKSQSLRESGTTLVKCMTNINVLVACMQEIFASPLYHSRQSQQSSPFLQVNAADMYIESCSKLGRLQSFCLKEELLMETEASESWKAAARIDETGKEAEDLKKAMEMLRRQSSHGDDLAEDTDLTPAVGSSESRTDSLNQEPGYRNYLILGHLTKTLSTNISKWFQCLAQSLIPKRRLENWQKQNAYKVAAALGDVLVYQFKPPFSILPGVFSLDSASPTLKYQYLDRILSTLWEVTMGISPRPQNFTNSQASCVTIVMVAFVNAKGLSLLQELTDICYSESVSRKANGNVENDAVKTHASQCLGSILSYCEQATSARCVVESPQSHNLKNPDRERPYHFLPAQLLLELRIELLPLIRKIWDGTQDIDSFLIKNAPRSMLESVVHSLGHVLEGDCENEAYRSSDLKELSTPPPPKDFTIHKERYLALKGEGYEKSLAREALFRCNNTLPAAQEYCKSFTQWFRESRNPPPSSEPAAKTPEEQGSPAGNLRASNQDNPTTSQPSGTRMNGEANRLNGDDVPSVTLDTDEVNRNHDTVGDSVDDELDSLSSEMSVDEPAPHPPTNEAQGDNLETSSISQAEGANVAQASKVFTIEDLDAERESIRTSLIEQCLNVLNEQHDILFELADLIVAASKKLSSADAAEYRETTGQLVVSMLTSLQFDLQSDDTSEEQRGTAGKKAAACAHFLALLLQDKSIYEACKDHLKLMFPTLVGFIRITPSKTAKKDEDSSPWIAQVLLIVEKMLSDESEPLQVQWTPPNPDGSVDGGPLASPDSKQIVTSDDKNALFEAIIDVLPRIGKDQSLALSTARVLVILTRTRQLAVRLSEKRNLQRLFLMVKQLTHATNDGLQSALMIILRHIVEDDSTLFQIMKSEIVANFDNRSSRGAIDITQYLRHMAHLVIRSPEVFVEATNTALKLQRFEGHSRAQALILRPDAKQDNVAKNDQPSSSKQSDSPNGTAQASDGGVASQNGQGETLSVAGKIKASEMKTPVVDKPDGLIHYLISELLSYKDVEDKEITVTARESTSENVSPATGHANANDTDTTSPTGAPELSPQLAQRPSSDTIRFKTEDHPIFTYRCFILQCLTELLYSYNRAKIEFINFSRKAEAGASTPSKPKGTVLNYLLNVLIPVASTESTNFLSSKKKAAISEWASKVVIALCAKTGELGIVVRERFSSGNTAPRIVDNDDEPDLNFVRRFVLEHAMKAFQSAAASSEPLDNKHARLLGLAELFQKLIQKPTASDASCGANNQSYHTLAKMMIEKNFIQMITSSVADIDLSSLGSKRVIKHVLKPLEYLTGTAASLSQQASINFSPAFGQADQDNSSSASSVSEVDNEREQTPDLFRHSTLGMLEPSGEDESSSDSDEDDDDADEVYDDEYDGMEYEEEMQPITANNGEVVSDEEADEMGRGSVEGMPGDVPVDIEVVMGGDEMDEDSDEEDDEEDDDMDDEEDDEEDPDGEDDIEIDDDDPIAAGEINGDEENASLGDVDGDGWESEDGALGDILDEDSQEFQNAMDNAEAVVAGDDPVVEDVQSGLDELLQIVGNDQGEDDQTPMDGMWPAADPATLFDQAQISEEVDYDDDMDEPDEDEDGLSYHEDNFVFDTNDDIPWGWENDEPPPIRSHHHRHHRHIHHGRHAGFFSNLLNHSDLYSRQAPRPSHRDDGTNPLLRRNVTSTQPQPSISFPAMDMIQEFQDIGQELGSIPGLSRRRDVMEAIISAVGRGERTIEVTRSGREYGLRIAQMPRHHRPMASFPSRPAGPFAQSSRDDLQQAVNFSSLVTSARWIEEAKLLFGGIYGEKALRVTNALLKILVPPAIEEEKARQKKLEEDRKREAEEKAEKERQARIAEEEAEKKRKEDEEREAARKAAQETMAVEAAVNTTSESQHTEQPASDGPPPEGTQANVTNTGETPVASGNEPDASTARVYTNIRGRNIDITDMSIDAEYLEALPEEFREEVIMRQYAEQRHQAEEQGQAPSDINREFLDALPEDIREELLQQEAQERRQRERDAARRRAADSGGPARAEEMDTDSFLASLDPALRRSILADSPEEVLQTMAPQFVAEARSMMSRTLNQFGRLPIARDIEDSRQGHEQTTSKDTKRQVVQMVDKSGVATLLRLMFMQLQGSTKPVLWALLHHICQHRQTRTEVINLLLLILQDGSADISAVERSFGHLSIRAKTSAQKPPQPLKRTLSLPAGQSANFEVTPLVVVQQCLSALQALNLENPNVAIGFLRETDNATNSKTKTKGKGKDDRAHRFAINALLGLLNRPMITEDAFCMEILSRILANITHALHRALKGNKLEDKPKEAPAAELDSSQPATVTQPMQENSQSQDEMTDSAVSAPSMESPVVDIVMTNSSTEGQLQSSAAGAQQSTERAADDGPSAKSEPTTTTEKGASKPEKIFDPPVIPEANLRYLVGVVAARECNSKIFRETISTMMNVSLIPETKEVFGRELIRQAQALCITILSDLDELLGTLRNAKDGLELQSPVFSKFTPAGSDQTKLLRVLTALDYLFDPKRLNSKDKQSSTLEEDKLLPILYESPEFGQLWSKVGECLATIRQKENMVSVATTLQNLIEALMVVCKNTSLKNIPISRQGLDTPTIRGNQLETLFFNFTEEHRKILNDLVRQNPKLMSGSFAVLIKNPKVLDFDNKLSYFRKRIRTRDGRHPQPPLQLSIRRNETFLDSFKSLYFKSAEEIKFGKLSIRFHGEEGVDAGGVTREWFQVLARGMFNPDYALFIPVASDRTTFHPNRLSGVNEEHLLFFKFIGRIIGKALYEGRVLDCHFSRAVYKRILGKTVSLKDMETLDLDYYKSLVWMLENDITDIITENFSVESADFGENRTIDLIPNGRHIPVTEENKQEYVQLVVEYRLTESIKEQLENFLKGFYEIIPAEIISIFNEQELELLISGLPDIDIDDWKANTEYHTYNASSTQIQWFWRAVRSFDKEEQAKLLQFVTGTSKVPLNGFKELEGMNGFSKFNIHKDYGNKERLPSSHTCFNQLDLPEYDDYETLRERLYMAMTTGSEYFGFA